jgi:hypothetical protein
MLSEIKLLAAVVLFEVFKHGMSCSIKKKTRHRAARQLHAIDASRPRRRRQTAGCGNDQTAFTPLPLAKKSKRNRKEDAT